MARRSVAADDAANSSSRREEQKVSVQTTTVPISANGYAERCRELDRLRLVDRPELAERMRLARADGHLDDNPALQELLAEQEQLERRIATLESHLALAEVVRPAGGGTIGYGSRVVVCDHAGREFTYELVGPLEADLSKSRVSTSAPVGRALFGRRRGDRVEVATPRGPLELEITSVRRARAR
jgi:transcription elongation factor GreA